MIVWEQLTYDYLKFQKQRMSTKGAAEFRFLFIAIVYCLSRERLCA